MTTSPDPVDRALALLREEHGAELPDPHLEETLRELHEASSRSREPRRPRLLAPLLAFGALTGAVAAGGGVEWIRSWWYTVEVGGVEQRGYVDEQGRGVVHFEPEAGGRGTVTVERDELGDDAVRTRVTVDRQGPFYVERESDEIILQGGGANAAPLEVTTPDGEVRVRVEGAPEDQNR